MNDNVDSINNLNKQNDEQEKLKYKNLQKILLNNNIDINNIKRITTDVSTNVFILLKNGTFYVNNKLEDTGIDDIYTYDANRIYKITLDNKIIPVKCNYDTIHNYIYGDAESFAEAIENAHESIDNYISGDGISYSKIIVGPWSLTALTKDKRVISTNHIPECICIIPDNFIDVDDIVLIDNFPYIIKHNELKPLYLF